jgi:hypothetical protein
MKQQYLRWDELSRLPEVRSMLDKATSLQGRVRNEQVQVEAELSIPTEHKENTND